MDWVGWTRCVGSALILAWIAALCCVVRCGAVRCDMYGGGVVFCFRAGRVAGGFSWSKFREAIVGTR
jgi:hypothetical protein